jgi:hypothetical protein
MLVKEHFQLQEKLTSIQGPSMNLSFGGSLNYRQTEPCTLEVVRY